MGSVPTTIEFGKSGADCLPLHPPFPAEGGWCRSPHPRFLLRTDWPEPLCSGLFFAPLPAIRGAAQFFGSDAAKKSIFPLFRPANPSHTSVTSFGRGEPGRLGRRALCASGPFFWSLSRLQPRSAALTKSAARSPIMMLGALVFPDTSRGITLASATHNPSIPFAFRVGSTTASASLPMRQVPTG